MNPLFFVVRGCVHPFDAPSYPNAQIVGWACAESALDAASEVAEADAQHDTYTAYEWMGRSEPKMVKFVPGEGVNPDPPSIAIG